MFVTQINVMQKEKCIHVRVEEPIHDFLFYYALENKMKVSDVVRNLCIFFYVACGNHIKNKTLIKLLSDKKSKKEFLNFLATITK